MHLGVPAARLSHQAQTREYGIRPANPPRRYGVHIDTWRWSVVRSSRWGEVLRCEEVASSNFSEAFLPREELRDFPPLARVAEIGQVKPIIADVLKSGEP